MLVSLLLLLPKPGSVVEVDSGGISPSGRLGSEGGISGSGFVSGGNTSGDGDIG
jgi:hypothetical protein